MVCGENFRFIDIKRVISIIATHVLEKLRDDNKERCGAFAKAAERRRGRSGHCLIVPLDVSAVGRRRQARLPPSSLLCEGMALGFVALCRMV
ncbi:uncharacterized protein G2W53_026827 [Senna tora]|uniref:Uncharacterized protein n=1 Tax=Senna tora TaxID=362788 RepID=A0A834THN4_9FABA|nr:uncharacterized protein G2W53_026827 [Senna tora]